MNDHFFRLFSGSVFPLNNVLYDIIQIHQKNLNRFSSFFLFFFGVLIHVLLQITFVFVESIETDVGRRKGHARTQYVYSFSPGMEKRWITHCLRNFMWRN